MISGYSKGTTTGRRSGRPLTAVVAHSQLSDDVSILTGRTGLTTRRPTTTRGMARPMTYSSSDGKSIARHRHRHPSGTNDFVSLLLQKERDLVGELEHLRAENEAMADGQSALPSLQDKHENLQRGVQELEAALSDHNIAMDRIRSRADASGIEAANAKLATTNERLADEVDQVFLLTQEREKEIAVLEKQMTAMHDDIEAKLTAGDAKQLELYHGLLRQMHNLKDEGRKRKEDITLVDRKFYEAKANSSTGVLRRKDYDDLTDKASKLQAELEGLDDGLALLDMPLSEAREYLVDKTEADKAKAASVDEEIAVVGAEIEELLSVRDSLLHDIGSVELQKNVQPEEMDRFLSTYHEQVATIMDEQSAIKDSIDRLRDQLDDQMDQTQGPVASQEDFEALRDDVSFATKQMDASESTLKRLEHMKLQREQELAKVKALEGKIADELAAIEEKTMVLEEEMVEYDDLVGLHGRCDLLAQNLAKQRDACTEKIAKTNPLIASLSASYKRDKAKLEADDNWSILQAMEEKQKAQAQTILDLKSFIEEKGRECEYASIKTECLQIARSMNEARITSLA